MPTIDSRPEKTIDTILSRWNAANLPLQYSIDNTKWPVNSEDMQDVISTVQDNNGYAQFVLSGTYEAYAAKEWVIIEGSTNYDGVHRIRSFDSGNTLTLDTPFIADDTGTLQKYYNNYTTLIRVYAGLDPTHEFAASKPIELIGTIEQRPDSDNVSLVDVRDYVKSKLTITYDATQSSWPNDLNAFADFYVSVAERYDAVSSGAVIDFTSEFTDDTESGDIIYLKAVHSALQFGDDNGGNMFDYVIFADEPYYDGTAKFMTFFERPKVIDYNPLDLSIIIDVDSYNNQFDLIIEEYDINNVLLVTSVIDISDSDYGVYRLAVLNNEFNEDTNYLNVYVDDGA